MACKAANAMFVFAKELKDENMRIGHNRPRFVVNKFDGNVNLKGGHIFLYTSGARVGIFKNRVLSNK
jgi:hypothetical protein